MYQVSDTLRAAIDAGNPQRALIEFFRRPDGSDYVPAATFSNEDILVTNGIRYTAEFNSETDLTIGLCPSAQIQFSMLNDVGQLAEFEFGTFRAYLGARITHGTPGPDARIESYPDGIYEFAPLGVFIAQRPDIVRKKIIDVDANDQMVLFDEELPPGLISYPKTLYSLANALCGHVGVTLKTGTWLNSTISVASAPDKFEGATMREIIGWIAEAACANARFDRDGKLEFVWFNDLTQTQTYDESNYSEFTPSWYETQAIDSLHIRNADETAERVFEGDTPGNNAYMIQDNPFLRTPESP